ncbi:coiled-coil domain-containing protein 124 [Syngnathoides biaculeatus]|uniref:coiled-coil domain-containing protein 124 n=1 Tax=Syngnathoides biaculeatus TaxID=300417 RepID=UPI002ADDD557|nr:coiled-coil domain-containing protein 124 [Syngnathoides biaculeatus]
MPKKFLGENSKAATARARKAEAKAVADARKKQEEDDALWQETDKHVLKKEQRKDDKEKKRMELLERKKESQRLLDEENASIKGKSQKESGGGKVTRAQIEEAIHNVPQPQHIKPKDKSHLEIPLEENVNRIIKEEGTVEARTVEDAIAVLSIAPEDLDRHPERRMKAAFTSYEEANMPRLKMENPNMRLSQLKQQLKKEWMKSPENPLNQRFAAYNSK